MLHVKQRSVKTEETVIFLSGKQEFLFSIRVVPRE